MMKSHHSIEEQIKDCEASKQKRQANIFRESVKETWRPLLGVWAKVKEERRIRMKSTLERQEKEHEDEYEGWRKAQAASLKDDTGAFTQREGRRQHKIKMQGFTERGSGPATHRGEAAVRMVSSGAFHAVALHRDGGLYAWGDGNFGRLGLGLAEDRGTLRVDKNMPTALSSLRGVPVASVDAGYSHR